MLSITQSRCLINQYFGQRRNSLYFFLFVLLCLCLYSSNAYHEYQKLVWSFSAIELLGLLLVGLGKISEWDLFLCTFLGSFYLPLSQQKIVLSGFNNQGMYFILTILLITAIIQKSNLLNRFVLSVLLKLAKKTPCLDSLIFFIGILITPLITSQSARLTIIVPVLDTVISSSKIKPKSCGANAIANAAFFGCILFSTIFLSGKSSNYLLLTLISHHSTNSSWLSWLYCASFPGILLFVSFFFLQSHTFKQNRLLQINRFTLLKSYLMLGKTKNDRFAAYLIGILFTGLIFSSVTQYSILVFDAGVLLLSFKTKFIKIEEMNRLINWTFLIYLVTIVGLLNFLSFTDPITLSNTLKKYLTFTLLNKEYCILFVFAFSWILSLIFGSIIAPGLVFTLLYPLFNELHINLWISSFVILMAAESWIFPYQSSYFICFKKLTSINKNFALKPLLKANCYFSLIKFLVLFASIPFWRILKLI